MIPNHIRLGAIALLMLLPATTHAGALKQAWQCAKATADMQVELGKTLNEKSEKVAELSDTIGPCMAEASADPEGFALIAGVITAVKIVSPSSMPNGQCYASVKGALAKPIALGLGAVLPSGKVKDGLISAANSPVLADKLWDTLSSTPPLSTLAGHVQCSCTILDDGLDLLDVSEVTSAISDVSSNCAGFLDSAHLGFINTYGGKAIRWTKSEYTSVSGQWDQLMGETNPAPDEVVYQRFYGSMVASMAQVIATKGGDVGSLSVIPPYYSANYSFSTASSTVAPINMGQMLDNCVAYYDSHTMSKSSALEVCNKWQARFPGEVALLVKEHKGATAFLIVAKTVQQRMFTDYGWRLPDQYPVKLDNSGSDTAHPFPWSRSAVDYLFRNIPGSVSVPDSNEPWRFTGTGIYASAPRLLPIVGFNAPRAYDLAYAGLRPAIRSAIINVWTTHPDVRTKYLPKVLPSPVSFAGPYGCPNTGPIVMKCAGFVEHLFDNDCRLSLGVAWADAKDILSIYYAEGGAIEACRAKLTPLVTAANDVTNTESGLSTLQKSCAGEPRSPAQTACLEQWSKLWSLCVDKAYGVPFSGAVNRAQVCLSKGDFKAYTGGRPPAPIQKTAAPGAPVGSTPAQALGGTQQGPSAASAKPKPVSPDPKKTTPTAPVRIGGGGR